MLTEHDEPMPHLADKFDIEAMRGNRDAGTADAISTAYEVYQGLINWDDFEADQRRIASIPAMEAEIERLRANLARAVEALEECQRDLDRYSQMEYPSDRYVAHRQRDYDGNPARIALASIKDKANG